MSSRNTLSSKLLKMPNSPAHSGPIKSETLGWDPAISVLTGPPHDNNAHYRLRITALDRYPVGKDESKAITLGRGNGGGG